VELLDCRRASELSRAEWMCPSASARLHDRRSATAVLAATIRPAMCRYWVLCPVRRRYLPNDAAITSSRPSSPRHSAHSRLSTVDILNSVLRSCIAHEVAFDGWPLVHDGSAKTSPHPPRADDIYADRKLFFLRAVGSRPRG